MSDDSGSRWPIDGSDLGFWIFFAIVTVFFGGSPDIADAIIYFLSDGKLSEVRP